MNGGREVSRERRLHGVHCTTAGHKPGQMKHHVRSRKRKDAQYRLIVGQIRQVPSNRQTNRGGVSPHAMHIGAKGAQSAAQMFANKPAGSRDQDSLAMKTVHDALPLEFDAFAGLDPASEVVFSHSHFRDQIRGAEDARRSAAPGQYQFGATRA